MSAWAGAGSLYSDAIVLACNHEVGADEIGDKCRHCEAEAAAVVAARRALGPSVVDLLRNTPLMVLMRRM